jgi:hypothetical protein
VIFFGLLDGVSLALSNYVYQNSWQLEFTKCIITGYSTLNYMKCRLEIMLKVDLLGNKDVHSLSVFV